MVNSGGLGAVIAANGDFSYPGWCDWMPFADSFQACQPATPAQIAASNNDLNPATVPNAAALNAANSAAAASSMCATFPDQCAGYNAAVNCPTIASMFGTGSVSQSLCNLSISGNLQWIVVGVAVFALLLLVKR
jgi:hypothetical protein